MTARTRAVLALAACTLPTAAAAALPPGVSMLRGRTGQHLAASLTYARAARTVNGFSIDFTCDGKPPDVDAHVWTVFDGGDDSVALTKAALNGRVHATLPAKLERFSEDGPVPKGTGTLRLDGRLRRSGSRRTITGTFRVRGTHCTPPAQTFRVSGG